MNSVDKNSKKYKGLVAIAQKPPWFTEEIRILEDKHPISAFILAACRLEGMCYRLACKLKSFLTNNSRIRFEDKELEQLTFGRLLGKISEMNLKIEAVIDCNILSRVYKVVELRNKIVHNFSKDINIGREDIEEEVRECLPDAKKLHYEIWKDYVNNLEFSSTIKDKVKK